MPINPEGNTDGTEENKRRDSDKEDPEEVFSRKTWEKEFFEI